MKINAAPLTHDEIEQIISKTVCLVSQADPEMEEHLTFLTAKVLELDLAIHYLSTKLQAMQEKRSWW